MLKKDFSVPEINIKDVNPKELNQNMSKVDWTIDHYPDALLEYSSTTKKGREQMQLIDAIIRVGNILKASNWNMSMCKNLVFLK